MLFLPSLVLLALLVVESVGEGCLLPRLPVSGTAAAMATAPAWGSQSTERACNRSSSVITFMFARYAFTLLTICASSNIFFGFGAAADFLRRLTVAVWPPITFLWILLQTHKILEQLNSFQRPSVIYLDYPLSFDSTLPSRNSAVVHPFPTWSTDRTETNTYSSTFGPPSRSF